MIAPASANTLAKLAHGLADNLLTTAALAAACPVVVAPAMNDRMFRHPATQANLDTLACARRHRDPARRGRAGLPRRARARPPRRAVRAARAACEALLRPDVRAARPWPGVRVLVTAGGTREPIDSVRFIGNRSSGRMGVALAARAAARGAEVTLIAANLALAPPPGMPGRQASRPRPS